MKTTDCRTRDYRTMKDSSRRTVIAERSDRNKQKRNIFFSDIPEQKKEILMGKRAYKKMNIETKKRQEVTEKAYRYEKLMKKYLWNFTRDFALIEDAVQDVYLRLMKEPSTITIRCLNDDEKFKKLCFTKSKQSLINLRNKADHSMKELLVEPVPYIENQRYTVFDTCGTRYETPQDKFDYEWLKAELEATIATMPKDVQAALRLYYAGAEIREACYELNMNQNVYKRIREEYVPKVAQMLEPKVRAYKMH